MPITYGVYFSMDLCTVFSFQIKQARGLSFPFVSSFFGCSKSASAGVDAYHEVQKQSHGGVLQKKNVPKTFVKLTEKHLCRSLFFNKVAGLRCEFCEIFKNIFFYRTPPMAAPVFSNSLLSSFLIVLRHARLS